MSRRQNNLCVVLPAAAPIPPELRSRYSRSPHHIPPQINGRVEPISHVNLMTDTLIANASPDDLRAIIRSMLASGPPGTLEALNNAARVRLQRSLQFSPPPKPAELFAAAPDKTEDPSTTQTLTDLLARCRALLGVNLGCESLRMFAIVVRGTFHLRWSDDGDLIQELAIIDADIAQAIQSCREQLEGHDRRCDMEEVRNAVTDLRQALEEGERKAHAWGGEFPFMRALANAESWVL